MQITPTERFFYLAGLPEVFYTLSPSEPPLSSLEHVLHECFKYYDSEEGKTKKNIMLTYRNEFMDCFLEQFLPQNLTSRCIEIEDFIQKYQIEFTTKDGDKGIMDIVFEPPNLLENPIMSQLITIKITPAARNSNTAKELTFYWQCLIQKSGKRIQPETYAYGRAIEKIDNEQISGIYLFQICAGNDYPISQARYYDINHFPDKINFTDNVDEIINSIPFENIEVKENSVELLDNALKSKRNKCMIGTGSMCDPYMPLEKSLCYMQKSLELIEKYGFGVTVITKSDLILRDLDTIERINKKTNIINKITSA